MVDIKTYFVVCNRVSQQIAYSGHLLFVAGFVVALELVLIDWQLPNLFSSLEEGLKFAIADHSQEPDVLSQSSVNISNT